jgi:murein DD-endopeptidase MepM/ murein hydrolase activator NlpD
MGIAIVRPKQKRSKLWIVVVILLAVLLPVIWVAVVRLEGEKPAVELQISTPYIGQSRELTLTVSDAKSGIRHIWLGLAKDGRENTLYDQALPAKSIWNGGLEHEHRFTVTIEPGKLGLSDGQAELRARVSDFSWRRWGNGNLTSLEQSVTIDTKPPSVEVIPRAHNINQGGAGLTVFRTSENCPVAGVQVGDNFFPAYPGYFKDPLIYVAFFALSYDQEKNTAIYVSVSDQAGNGVRVQMAHYIRGKAFRRDIIRVTDSFLETKLPEFKEVNSSGLPLIEQFLKINRELRQENYRQVMDIARQTDTKMHWEGVFLRLPQSANRAGFADHRMYQYNGKEVDREVHLGVDLASLTNSPVPAGNAGRVAFTGYLGIYGNTVLIDHGFGLFSMYSHLSQINVKQGDNVAKGDRLGATGSTGLAGGDHLHFAMLVHNTFVNPIEWWDASWISHNVTSKLEDVKAVSK